MPVTDVRRASCRNRRAYRHCWRLFSLWCSQSESFRELFPFMHPA